MKITKQRLKAIIKEELAEADIASIRADLERPAGEPRNPEPDLPTWEGYDDYDTTTENTRGLNAELLRVASSLGAGKDFVDKVNEAITNAVSSEGMGRNLSLKTMIEALRML